MGLRPWEGCRWSLSISLLYSLPRNPPKVRLLSTTEMVEQMRELEGTKSFETDQSDQRLEQRARTHGRERLKAGPRDPSRKGSATV